MEKYKFRNTTPLLLVSIASLLLTIIFVNRWVITDLGIFSFGRVWQYFVSWTDFGFARRELWGTILSVTGINRVFENPYHFAYVFYILKILVLVGGLLFFLLKKANKQSFWFYFSLFFSPVLILQSGYLTGTQDLQLILIAMAITLYIENTITFTVGCVLGILTHELFIFLLPFLFLVHLFKTSEALLARELFKFRLVAPALITVFFILVTAFSGKVNVSELHYNNVMAKKIPAAVENHSLWSGYTEVGSSIEQNAKTATGTLKSIAENKSYVALPFLYVVLVGIIAVSFITAGGIWFRAALFISILFPMLTVFVATDIYRWIGMTGNLAWLSILVALGRSQYSAPIWYFVVLSLFVVIAPFGAAEIARPFPAQQLLLEKIGFSEFK